MQIGPQGERPATVDVDAVSARLEAIARRGTVRLLGEHEIAFTVPGHLEFNRRQKIGYHLNGMRFTAYDGAGTAIRERVYASSSESSAALGSAPPSNAPRFVLDGMGRCDSCSMASSWTASMSAR